MPTCCTDKLFGLSVTQTECFLLTSKWLHLVFLTEKVTPRLFYLPCSLVISRLIMIPILPHTITAQCCNYLGSFWGVRRPGLGTSSCITALLLYAMWFRQLHLYLYHACLLRLCYCLKFMETKKICPLNGTLKNVPIDLVVAYWSHIILNFSWKDRKTTTTFYIITRCPVGFGNGTFPSTKMWEIVLSSLTYVTAN
jgi:hypothetical protein